MTSGCARFCQFLISQKSKFTFIEPIHVLLVYALSRAKDVRRKNRQLGSTDLYFGRFLIQISLTKK